MATRNNPPPPSGDNQRVPASGPLFHPHSIVGDEMCRTFVRLGEIASRIVDAVKRWRVAK